MADATFTEIVDIIEPEIMGQYIVEKSTALDEFIQSGIAASSPEIDKAANSAGRYVELPFWDDLSGESQVATDDETEVTTVDLSTDYDACYKDLRTNAWKHSNTIKYVAGSDPAMVVAERVAKWIVTERQRLLLSKLSGAFDAASMAVLVNDISSEDGDNATDNNLIDAGAILDTMHLLGDHWNSFTGIAIHSVPFKRLQNMNMIDFEPDSDQKIQIPFYLGRRVFVDDNMTSESGDTSGTQYTTIVFGPGAIAYAQCPLSEPVYEIVRDPKEGTGSGQVTGIVRMHHILHPRGVRYASTESQPAITARPIPSTRRERTGHGRTLPRTSVSPNS
jgi:hypothetical protein